MWTDGSRLDSGRAGAVAVWWEGTGWEGRLYCIGRNKEVYDVEVYIAEAYDAEVYDAEVYHAEVYATHRALQTIDQRGESGRRYTIFSDSASAIGHARSDSLGPGQRLAVAIHEVDRRTAGRSNGITIRWTPAHRVVEGNETAAWAKAAAENRPPNDDPTNLRAASLSHMTRRATGAKAQTTKDWIAEQRPDPLTV